MQKLYDRIYWKNNSVPALNESNLNAMSKALDEVDTRLTELAVGITNIDDSVEQARDSATQARASEETARKYASQVYHYTPAGYPDLVARADMVSNPNLLDNGWFNVNSRGQSSYRVTGYTFDRWKSLNNHASLTKNNDGTVGMAKLSGDYGYYVQTLENIDLSTQKVTLSAIVDGEIYSSSGIKPSITVKNLHVYCGNSTFNFRVGEGSCNVKAFKLELGSISTLEYDTAPNHAEELIRCQASTADSTDAYANKGVLTDDAWVATKPYVVGDYCIFNNVMYQCKVQHTNVIPPTDTTQTYWKPTSVGKEFKKNEWVDITNEFTWHSSFIGKKAIYNQRTKEVKVHAISSTTGIGNSNIAVNFNNSNHKPNLNMTLVNTTGSYQAFGYMSARNTQDLTANSITFTNAPRLTADGIYCYFPINSTMYGVYISCEFIAQE